MSMETVKEKLAKLIENGKPCPNGNPFDEEACLKCRYKDDKHCDMTRLVDYLIQNGVTIATDTNVKWVHDEGGCWYCPKCGCTPAYWEAKDDNQYGLPPYCHSCGAKLEPPKGVQ